MNGIAFLYSFLICSLLVYRQATDFWKLIVYPATLLKLFMVFLCEVFQVFKV
jgi:NhaP-type Na+/H+ and K+/H+ antiporter